MDLALLDVFRAVAQEQSITKAAEVLGRVPSNVTTRIQQLESEIGVSLFLRDKKRMELTAEGVTYLDYAMRILNLMDEAQQVVNPSAPMGMLRIGSMESTAATRLPVPLAQFNARWPRVTLNLSTAPSLPLVEALLAHRIDCALIALPPEAEWFDSGKLEKKTVVQEELVLLLPPGHREVKQPTEIIPRALAAFASGCTYRMLAEEWISGSPAGKKTYSIQEVKSYHAMIACTATGSCFSILPRSVLERVPHLEHFTIQPITAVDTVLVWRRGFKTPAFLAFRDLVSEGL